MRKILVAGAITAVVLSGCAKSNDSAYPTSAPYTSAPTAKASASASPASNAITTAGDCTDETSTQGNADLEQQDFQFAPPCLVISTSQGLHLHNTGSVPHNFSVKNFAGLDVDVQPGQENNTEALGLDPGTYDFFCKFHVDSHGMKGKLEVKAA